MRTAAPVFVTWELWLALFSSERMIDILLVVNGECNDKYGDEVEGGFGKWPTRANGGIGRLLAPYIG